VELPSLRDAERLQGFEPDWTAVVEQDFGRRERWKLIGNAVCVPMMQWLACRLEVVERHDRSVDSEWDPRCGWPSAAWGRNGVRKASNVGEWPIHVPRESIISFLKHRTTPLSFRAADGFLKRARASALRFEDGFLDDVEHHARRMKSLATA
jgi:DNA (cytosine-5)-methyltransferase 1